MSFAKVVKSPERMKSPERQLTNHKLRFKWSFWFSHRAPGVKASTQNYSEQMKQVVTVSTAEEFWHAYQHLKRPSQLPVVSDYHFFKQGVKPMWEDAENINGGKWIVRIKKGLADRFWENLLIAIVSDQFAEGSDICGAVLSLRTSEDMISLWNKSSSSNLGRIQETIKAVLNLPNETIIEYKAHKEALADNSSYRNAEVYR